MVSPDTALVQTRKGEASLHAATPGVRRKAVDFARRRFPWNHRASVAVRLLIACATLIGALPCFAQPADPNLAHPHAVITAAREGYTISALVTHEQNATRFKHGIALFPGYPGIMKLRVENGEPRFEMAGNFLVRSRRQWLDADTLVAVVDAPSDQWAAFSQQFRESPRYGADVAALISEIARRYAVESWTFVGTSEGSITAFHAARMNPQLARRTILTASVFPPNRNGPGLSNANWAALASELLWVHHADDPCPFTSYRDAQAHAAMTGKPLVTVRGGGPGRGPACEARTAHGFAGVERETVQAMRSWVQTGVVPGDVRP